MRTPGQIIQDSMAKDSATFFGSFKQHFSQNQPHAELVLLESLRALYPNRLITMNASSIDIVGFAQAGFAQAERVHKGVDEMVDYFYVSEDNRLSGGDGCVKESIELGEYEYTYQGVQSTIFIAQWPTSDGCTTRRVYYLAPEQEPQSSVWAMTLLKAAGKYGSELHDEIYVFDNGYWGKDDGLWKAVKDASWEDVILNPTMKNTLIRDVEDFFDSRMVYEEYGVPWKRGIILHGTPGCGKTISIKALMKAIHAHGAMSLYVKSFASRQGTNQAVRTIFEHARKMAPCMLIFEDLDSLVVDNIRSYFLNEVDGLESNHGILMVGSTNHLDRLDPGISKRPSRFDRKYYFELPGTSERMLYCNYWRGKLSRRHDLDFSEELCKFITELTEGFSFAYLKELFVQTLLAIVGGRADDPDEDIDAAVADVADNTAVDENSSRLLRSDENTSSTEAAADVSADDGARESAAEAVEVEIPAQLQPNPLARVFRRQIRALRKDMDSTAEETAEDTAEGKAKGTAKGKKAKGKNTT